MRKMLTNSCHTITENTRVIVKIYSVRYGNGWLLIQALIYSKIAKELCLVVHVPAYVCVFQSLLICFSLLMKHTKLLQKSIKMEKDYFKSHYLMTLFWGFHLLKVISYIWIHCMFLKILT